MVMVRCNACGWIGPKDDLIVARVIHLDDAGNRHEDIKEACPRCGRTDALMDLKYGCSFDPGELETLWKEFGYVGIDDEDYITEEFLGFPEGTDRFEIWHWFEDHGFTLPGTGADD